MPTIDSNTPAGSFSNYSLFMKTADVTYLQNITGLYEHPSIKSFIPGQLRVRDMDSDGYPDIMVSLSHDDGSRNVVVLVNEE